MQQHQRILYSTTDLSNSLNEFGGSSVSFAYTSGGYLYIGQEVPFNNIWVDVSVANEATASIAIEIWWANQWLSAVDIYDGTTHAGKSLARDGRITFTPRWDRGWTPEQRCELITGLEDWEIYDLYWARLSWNTSLSANTALKYIGQKFSNDDNLYDFYPDLRNQSLRTAWAQSPIKDSWNDQHYAAAESIVDDLIRRRLIESRGQIVDWSILRVPSVHKVAEIIYSGLGTSYAAHMQRAEQAYARSMQKELFRVDRDRDGRLSVCERRQGVTFMSR